GPEDPRHPVPRVVRSPLDPRPRPKHRGIVRPHRDGALTREPAQQHVTVVRLVAGRQAQPGAVDPADRRGPVGAPHPGHAVALALPVVEPVRRCERSESVTPPDGAVAGVDPGAVGGGIHSFILRPRHRLPPSVTYCYTIETTE